MLKKKNNLIRAWPHIMHWWRRTFPSLKNCRKIWSEEHCDQHCGWTWSSQLHHHVLWLHPPQLCPRKEDCKFKDDFTIFLLFSFHLVWGGGSFSRCHCMDNMSSVRYWENALCAKMWEVWLFPLCCKLKCTLLLQNICSLTTKN